jgi:hypothetical protein
LLYIIHFFTIIIVSTFKFYTRYMNKNYCFRLSTIFFIFISSTIYNIIMLGFHVFLIQTLIRDCDFFLGFFKRSIPRPYNIFYRWHRCGMYALIFIVIKSLTLDQEYYYCLLFDYYYYFFLLPDYSKISRLRTHPTRTYIYNNNIVVKLQIS